MCPSPGFRTATSGLRYRRAHLRATPGQVGPEPKKAKKPIKGSLPTSEGNGANPYQPQVAIEDSQHLDELDEETEQELAPYMDAVVKVYCIHTEPNWSLPWQRRRQYTSTSSGFIVTGEPPSNVAGPTQPPVKKRHVHDSRRWLLTNAHSVHYHTQVKVKRRGDDRRYLARVLSIGVDCDIALLTVDDEAFWQGVTPLSLGPLPKLQESVAVVGYPIGGDTISVTAGVVSRIEVTNYSHGSMDLLGVQIDAAINSGNSGGPVFNKHCQCVGIAFQALTGSDVENVGYVIPTPVVHHFLNDYRLTGTFSGFPALGIMWQAMESEVMRRAYKMAAGQKGILLRKVNPSSAAAALLQRNDVLLSFDGTDIAYDGSVPFRTGERISFSYLISNKYVGDAALLRINRGGEIHELSVRLSRPISLVPNHISEADPSFLVVGGLVFTPLTEPYLAAEYGAEWSQEAPVKLLEKMYHTLPATPDEQVVVLSQVLACDATLGFEEFHNVTVYKFNGQHVSNLQQLACLVVACEEPYMRFDLEYNEVVILETAAARAATSQVMAAHSIPHALSADLRPLLPAEQAWPPLVEVPASATTVTVT